MQPPIPALQYKTPHYAIRPSTAYITIHHAAVEYSAGGALQAIYEYHKQRWPSYAGIGYHVVIQEERDGSLTPYLVNPPEQIGAHVGGHNHEAFGICAATNLSLGVSAAWWDALVAQAAYWSQKYPHAQLIGHREKRDTTCPGNWWAQLKDEFIKEVAIMQSQDPFLTWEQAGFPISEQQRSWAIPQAWLGSQSLGVPTSYETYLNSFQSFQGFENGTLYYNARSGLVVRID